MLKSGGGALLPSMAKKCDEGMTCNFFSDVMSQQTSLCDDICISTSRTKFEYVFQQWLPWRLVGTQTGNEILDIIRRARQTWACNISSVTMDFGFRTNISTSEECIEFLARLQEGSLHERLGMQPSVLEQLKLLVIHLLTVQFKFDYEDTRSFRECALATLQADKSLQLSEYNATCSYCGQMLQSPQRCSFCRLAGYCSRQCQRADWNKHKYLCQKMSKIKRLPTCNEMLSTLLRLYGMNGTYSSNIVPFIVPLSEGHDNFLAALTVGYDKLCIKPFYFSKKEIVYGVLLDTPVQREILGIPLPNTETVDMKSRQDRTVETHGVTEVTIDSTFCFQCMQCNAHYKFLLLHPRCLCLLCADCVSQKRMKERCRCGTKMTTLMLARSNSPANLQGE